MHPRFDFLASVFSIRIVGTLLSWIVLGAAIPAFGQASVQQIEVRLTFEDTAPHPVLADRLQATAESVVERLLLGRPLDQAQAVQPRLGETIATVLDRVATGYVVTAASAQLGVTATVTLRLRTVGPVMQDASVRGDLTALHARVRPLADGPLMARAGEIRALVTGLPVAALGWAEPAVAGQVRLIVEAAVPGYTGAVGIHPGPPAVVDVVLTVRDSRVVRNIGVRFRSTSIPTLLLDQNAPQVASMAEPLRGLPVAFAEAQRGSLARLINEELGSYGPVREYHIVTSVGLDVAETTYINVVADSLLYRGRVEAHLNIGALAPNPEIIAHLGRLVAPLTELFAEIRLVPNTLSADWHLGLLYQVSADAAVGANYAVVAQTTSAWITVQLGRDVSARGRWHLTQPAFEGAFTYRINEFLAGEVVATSRNEFWLRLISNL